MTPVEAVAMSMQQRGERHIDRMAGVSERAVDHIETMDGPEILNSVDQIEKLDKVARRTFKLDDVPPSGYFTLNNFRIDSLKRGGSGQAVAANASCNRLQSADAITWLL